MERTPDGETRDYDLVIIDEAGLVKKGLRATWEQAIRPTLIDRDGRAIMAGTPKGIDDENFVYVAATDETVASDRREAEVAASLARVAEAFRAAGSRVVVVETAPKPLVWDPRNCSRLAASVDPVRCVPSFRLASLPLPHLRPRCTSIRPCLTPCRRAACSAPP